LVSALPTINQAAISFWPNGDIYREKRTFDQASIAAEVTKGANLCKLYWVKMDKSGVNWRPT
jgi:hypothetical protein